jgi:hypothetical protein
MRLADRTALARRRDRRPTYKQAIAARPVDEGICRVKCDQKPLPPVDIKTPLLAKALLFIDN